MATASNAIERAQYRTKAARLVGAATFVGGYLGGSMAALTLDGTFAASP